jgi:uncharacterized protein YuzE
MIETSYDPAADALFIWLAPEHAVSMETHEILPGEMLDYHSSGQVIGIELLDVRARGVGNSGKIAAE